LKALEAAMCIPWVKVNRLLFEILCLVPLLTACLSQSPDDINPTLTLLGDAERTVSQDSIIIEGELEDNIQIASFSYRLNGGTAENIIDSLGETLYRFIITDLQQGENNILVKATDPSGNTVEKDLKVNVTSLDTASVDGVWQDTDINYSVCSKPSHAALSLHFDQTQQTSYLGGSASLASEDSITLGHFQGYMDNGIINGVLTLMDEHRSLGQIKLTQANDTLSGSVTFKNAASCTSASTEDIRFDLELSRGQ
jgi:hypothetical protein